MSEFTIGAVIGASAVGLILGAIPAILGVKKGKTKLAIIGFFACLVSALILGALLAVPVCVIFIFLICKKDKKNLDSENNNTRNED